MVSRILRTRRPINYYEPDEPPDDAYEFCAECGNFTFEHCSIHGGLLVVPDDKVSAHQVSADLPRAKLSAPKMFLYIDTSSIPGAGVGVFAKKTLPLGVRFGPYCGQRMKKAATDYCWQICDARGRSSHVVDASDENTSNWMRYVNCARHFCEQNLVAYQFHGQIYYRTSQIIRPGTELLVFYGCEFAAALNIHLGKYHSKEVLVRAHQSVKQQNSEAQSKGSKKIDINETLKTTPEEIQRASAYMKALIRLEKYCNQEKYGVQNFAFLDREVDFLSLIFMEVDELEDRNRNRKIHKANSNPIQLDEELNHSSNSVNVDRDGLSVDISNNDKHNVIFIESEDNDDPKSAPENDGNIKKTTSTELDVSRTNGNINSIWKCNVCNQVLGSRDLLRGHKRMHGGAQKFNCPICSYKTDVEYYYKRHEQLHNKTKGITNGNKLATANQKDDARIQSANKPPWQCKECQLVFTTRDNLRNHKYIHSDGTQQFFCNICSYQTDKKYFFVRHMKGTHSNLNKAMIMKCSKCSFSTKNDKLLKIHVDLHVNNKTIKCDMCNYLCTTKKYLNAHLLRVHMPTKLHQCAVCASAFNCAEYLRRHMRNVHG